MRGGGTGGVLCGSGARCAAPASLLAVLPSLYRLLTLRRCAGYWLLAGALALSSCLESATPDLIPRQPTLALDFPVGDSAVGLTYLPVTVKGQATTYAGLRSLRLFVSRDGAPETLYRSLATGLGAGALTIDAAYVPNGARRALLRTELVDEYGYRLERTLSMRFITGLPLSLSLTDSLPAPPTTLARGAGTVVPLRVLSQGALREMRIYEQIGASAPRLLRTVAGAEFTHPNNVPILWDFAYHYAAPTGVRPRQQVTVRFELASVSGLTTSLSYAYSLTP